MNNSGKGGLSNRKDQHTISSPSIASSSNQPSTVVQRQRRRRAKRSKRCHGNAKLRRFRQKCRQRGLTEQQIQVLIDNYHPDQRTNRQTTKSITTTRPTDVSSKRTTVHRTNQATTTSKPKEKAKKSKHRPIIVRFQSLRQGLPKKIKKIITKKRKHIVPKQNIKFKINMLSMRSNYHSPNYLKTSRTLVFQILSTQLKRNLRSKVKQTFIYQRLHLFDRYCRIELHTNLWQSFLG